MLLTVAICCNSKRGNWTLAAYSNRDTNSQESTGVNLMTLKKLLLSTTLLLPLMAVQTGHVQAGTFIQNACWLVSDEESSQSDEDIVVLGVTETGGGHYGFSGYVMSMDDEEEDSPQILNGSGEILGSQLIIGLNGVVDDSEAVGKISYYLKINLNGLNGSFNGIGTFYDKSSGTVQSDRGEGNLTYTECPA